MKYLSCFWVIMGSVLTVAVAQAQRTEPLFTPVQEKESGVRFINAIQEDDSLHVMKYEYLYNGHGIGVADFNGDGWQDLFFSGNRVPNKLYLNTKGFSFRDITSEAGVSGNGTWRTGVSVADVNGDGLPDIYVCHSGKFSNEKDLSNELFINKGLRNGVPYFEEAAKQYGLDAPGTQSTQAAFFDYDRDGDLDMFLLNHSNHTYNPYLNTRKVRATPHSGFGNRLFRNDRRADGSQFFTDVTLQAGIINNALNFGLSVTISDMNGDGWPDIYTTSDYTEQDCFYVNRGDGTFRQALQQSFTHISKYSMGADIADYNNDGRPDVVTLDMLPQDNYRQKLLKGPDEYDAYHLLLDSGYYHQQMRNMLHLNCGLDAAGNLRFSEIGQLAGISNTDWSWAPLLADLDNDGWKDLVVTNGYLRDFTDLDFLKYTVANAQLEEAAKGNMNFRTYDLVKKMPSNKLTNYLFKNNGDLTFTDKSRDWGFAQPSVSNAAVYADLDNDGDLDLVIGNNNEPVMLYRNNAQQLKNQSIKLDLKGKDGNTAALGAKVWLYAGGTVQYAELYPVRGYQSSVAPVLLFGLGTALQADSVVVQWPDGSFLSRAAVPAGETLVLKQEAASRKAKGETAGSRVFSDFTQASGLHFRHQENAFVDFKDEVLLPYQLSKMGPALAKADVNGDGLEDVFVGGAIGQTGKLFLQQASGSFTAGGSQPWYVDRESEDVKAIFFDADKDGDADLYVVSGGNEYGDGSPEYADRLYLNDGKGTFHKQADALPAMLSSKQAVAAGDMDGDGDLDLFIGGSAIPGSFPLPARSYLLRNDTKNGVVRFTDVTEAWCKELLQPGMVTTALWQDLDKDGYPELLIGGDWMPLLLFKNGKDNLQNHSEGAGLANTNGLWSSLLAEDIDGDGDLDFVAGNSGWNNQFRASLAEPMTLHAADFDDNGTLDAITCYYIQGKSYPMASRDELLDQIVPLRKKFVKYRDYANASLADIFPKNKLAAAEVKSVYQLASCILRNDGKNRFTLEPLPVQAQFSKLFGMVAGDLDKDGKKDLLLAGNFFPYRVQLGRNDAGLGVWLKGDDAGTYKVVPNEEAGLFIDGDVRNLITVTTKNGETLLVVARNNDAVQVLKLAK